MFNREYKLGLRAIKTAISVMFCLFFAFALKRPDGFFASIAAIICTQQTAEESFDMGIHRLLGTVVGGLLGYVSLIFLQNFRDYLEIINIMFVPLIVLFVVYICNIINYKASAQIACVVLLSLLISREKFFSDYFDVFMHVINRILDTSVGITIAVLVNRLIFFPKDIGEKITNNIQDQNSDENLKAGNIEIGHDISESKNKDVYSIGDVNSLESKSDNDPQDWGKK